MLELKTNLSVMQANQSTHIVKLLKAPREMVYQALIQPEAIAQWRVPDNMKAHIHSFEAREGGRFRISLTYEDHDTKGKTSGHTDTYHGYFKQLVPNEKNCGDR